MQRDGNGRERAPVPRAAANDNTGSKAGTGSGFIDLKVRNWFS